MHDTGDRQAHTHAHTTPCSRWPPYMAETGAFREKFPCESPTTVTETSREPSEKSINRGELLGCSWAELAVPCVLRTCVTGGHIGCEQTVTQCLIPPSSGLDGHDPSARDTGAGPSLTTAGSAHSIDVDQWRSATVTAEAPGPP